MISNTLTARNGDRPPVDPTELDLQQLKTVIHEELIESLDLSVVEQVDEKQLSAEIRRLAEEICSDLGRRLSEDAHRRMLDELMDEIFGLGPLEQLMHTPVVMVSFFRLVPLYQQLVALRLRQQRKLSDSLIRICDDSS